MYVPGHAQTVVLGLLLLPSRCVASMKTQPERKFTLVRLEFCSKALSDFLVCVWSGRHLEPDVTSDELRDLFAKYGELLRILFYEKYTISLREHSRNMDRT